VPATRIALKSGKLRHEIVMDESGEVDSDSNDPTMASTLLAIEKENHDAVQCLEAKGYTLAHNLKRSVRRDNKATRPSDPLRQLTVPGMTEHQRALS